MAWDWEVVGWQGFSDDERHDWQPDTDELSDAHGLLVHFWDDETGEDDWNWIYNDIPYDWDEWDDLIAMYADEGPS